MTKISFLFLIFCVGVGVGEPIKCNFECMRDRIVGAEKCNYHGDYECGICDCYQNYFGDECQFEKPPCPNNGANCSDCINPVTNTICTDQGECPDNYCLCDSIPGGTLSGKWCQCNTQHCFNRNVLPATLF